MAHTSTRYNCTFVYAIEIAKATFGLIQYEKFKLNETAIKAWLQYKAGKQQREIGNANFVEGVFNNCVVK